MELAFSWQFSIFWISLYFRYLALQKIVGIAERTNYSHYIVTRSDYNYTIPHPQVLLDNALMVPYGEDYDGLCDRHMVIPRQFAVQTLSILYALGKGYDPKLEWWRNRIETLLDAWTKELKLEVRRFPRMMYSVVASTNEQRISWSNGTRHPDMSPGILLKYVSEYEETKRTEREWWKCKKYGWTPSCSARFQFWQGNEPKVSQITGAVNLLLGIDCAGNGAEDEYHIVALGGAPGGLFIFGLSFSLVLLCVFRRMAFRVMSRGWRSSKKLT